MGPEIIMLSEIKKQVLHYLTFMDNIKSLTLQKWRTELWSYETRDNSGEEREEKS